MAHGLANHLYGHDYSFYSAGIESHGLNPMAVEVMNEIGVDISHHESQLLSAFNHLKFDLVVSVCQHAAENCPDFSDQTKVIHNQFDDPPKLAAIAESKEEELYHFRKVRDEIHLWASDFLIEKIETH
jgi:arsenate reductase